MKGYLRLRRSIGGPTSFAHMSNLSSLRAATNIRSVAALLGFEASALAFVLYGKSAPTKYTKFTIPKRAGGAREISAPNPQLKLIQRRLANILQDCEQEVKQIYGRHDDGPRPDMVSHGFVRKRSIVSNARQHRHRRFVFNVDLENFFPSINFGRVRGFFIKDHNFGLKPAVATILAQIACEDGALPQGSPCSPVIANLIGHILDVHLVRLAARNGCTYTIYADALTFSTNQKSFPASIAIAKQSTASQWEVGAELSHLISKSGFIANANKTRMQFMTSQQIVTGLVVTIKVNVSSDYRRKVRAMVHRLFTTGTFDLVETVASPPAATAVATTPGSLSQLHGMLGFIDGVDLYNRRLAPRTKSTALSTKELMYRRFLFFKDFYSAQSPVLVCEGKTDTVYLTHAIRSLAASFPRLASVDATGKVTLALRRYRYAGRSTGRILGLGGGHGDLQKFLCAYRDDVMKFKASGMKNPVIVLVDNDNAAKPTLSAIKNITGKPAIATDPFIHVTANLYVVLTPLIGDAKESMIEDFFDSATKALKFKGKDFDPSNDFSNATHFGKADFAYHVVQPNADTIDFSGFSSLLSNISLVVEHHIKKQSLAA